MTHLAAAGPGLILVLVVWAIWYLIDPPLRPDGVSWVRLLFWVFTPVGLYVFLAHHREPPSTMGSPVGKEGTVARLHPLEVEVFGSFWSARSATPGEYRLGERVRVVERAGLTLTIDRLS